MKKQEFGLLISLVLIFMISCNTVDTEISWKQGLPNSKSIEKDLVLIKFYGDDCSHCINLDKKTLSQPQIIKLINKQFDCYKVNTWKKENSEIRLKHRVWTEPVMIFKNRNGEEIDRIVGFIDATKLNQELERISEGHDTYFSLRKQHLTDPENQEILYQLALKETNIGRSGDSSSQVLWLKLMDISAPNTFSYDIARFNYYTGILWKNEQPDSLIETLNSIKDYDFKLDGFKSITDFYNYKKDSDNELLHYRYNTDYLLKHNEIFDTQKRDDYLSSYAWRMTEMNQYLEDALFKIDFVLSKLTDDIDNQKVAELLDTKSEILWKLGRNNEAIHLVDDCIKLLPDNEYLQEKKNKISQELI